MARFLYQQGKANTAFLGSNDTSGSVSRTDYARLLALASIDIILTLPIGITNIVLVVISSLHVAPIPFYWGWSFLHADWEPVASSYAELKANGTANVALFYVSRWDPVVLTLAIFGLFGLTREARSSYRHVIGTAISWYRRKSTRCSPSAGTGPSTLDDIEFRAGQQGEISFANAETR